LGFLQEETPQLLVEVAPRVAQILDRVSEASARGYQLSPEGTWPPGPVSGIGVALHDAGVLVYAPRYLSLSAKDTALTQTSGGQILLLRSPLKEVEEALRELAKAHAAVLWAQEGRSREEVQKDLEEALLLGPLLRMPPGLYPVRLLWPLSMALESSRGQERLMRLVKPLEEHPDLWQTLEAFLKAGLSLKRTAHRLGLHPNTVLYRIHRIEELTGLHLERVEDLCLLQIALQLREALGR
jgi:DNA-binding PucR family transcriptional regulator